MNDGNLKIEWGQEDPTEKIKYDFDAELRLQCIANYWDPPIFLYGLIDTQKHIQTVAVLIRNNRRNLPVVFFIEINFENLFEIHVRICEIIMMSIDIYGNLPSHHLVLKCSDHEVLWRKFLILIFFVASNNNFVLFFQLAQFLT